MLPRNRAPTHPGVLLKELYLDPREVTITSMSDAAGISRKHLSQIIHGRAGISPEVAVRIADVLGTTEQLWLNAQSQYDLWHARRRIDEGRPIRVGAFALPSPEQSGAA